MFLIKNNFFISYIYIFFSNTDVLRFDNTYSWVNSKKIYYTLEVIEPSGLEDIHAEIFVTSF